MEQKIENLDSILSKLRKLQKLYEGAKKINSEAEAEAAAAAIQKILTQYNLAVEDIGEEKPENSIKDEWISGYTYKSIGGRWELELTDVLCDFNFCKLVFIDYAHLRVFGKKENIETIKWLKSFLSEKYVALSKQRYKEYLSHVTIFPMSKDKFQRNYLRGCVRGLYKKFENEKQSQDVKVTALILRNKEAISTYVNSRMKLHDVRTPQINNDCAFSQGYEDGLKTVINKELE